MTTEGIPNGEARDSQIVVQVTGEENVEDDRDSTSSGSTLEGAPDADAQALSDTPDHSHRTSPFARRRSSYRRSLRLKKESSTTAGKKEQAGKGKRVLDTECYAEVEGGSRTQGVAFAKSTSPTDAAGDDAAEGGAEDGAEGEGDEGSNEGSSSSDEENRANDENRANEENPANTEEALSPELTLDQATQENIELSSSSEEDVAVSPQDNDAAETRETIPSAESSPNHVREHEVEDNSNNTGEANDMNEEIAQIPPFEYEDSTSIFLFSYICNLFYFLTPRVYIGFILFY